LAAKAPKITPAQRELEALQLQALLEQQRNDNTQNAAIALNQRRMLLGQLGYNQFLTPGLNTVLPPAANLPAAQAAGAPLSPDLADPAIAALQRRQQLTENARGFGVNFAAATQALALRRRI
jgi:hypothetical protein